MAVIAVVNDARERREIARAILESLTEWFEVPESRERHIADSAGETMVASWEDGRPVGFLCLKETGKDTVELKLMGVLKAYHRRGVGRSLFEAARRVAVEEGYSFMQVKTVRMGCYEEYDRTNLFYRSLGFKEFEVMPGFWDSLNPCQIYVMSLEDAGAGRASPPCGRRRTI